jgi:hypothetical protein
MDIMGMAMDHDDRLTAFAGFQSRGGAYTSASSDKPSTGDVHVSVAIPGDDDEPETPPPPTVEQAKAYQHLKDNQDAIAAAVLQAIAKEYPTLQESYGYEDDEAEELMPDITKPEDLRNLIGLGIVHVLAAAKKGAAYVGFEFGCTWDEEHGLGVLTHGTRVVAVGAADTSFDLNAAEDDGGKPLQAP